MTQADEPTFADAVRHYQAGGIAEAARLIGNILATDPRHADSLHLLGIIAGQSGRYDLAVELISRASRLQEDNPFYHYNLSGVLQARNRTGDAMLHYERALLLKPDYADAHNYLAYLLLLTGNPVDAVAHYEQALAINPGHGEAHNNLGNVLKDQGKFDAAMWHYNEAIRVDPNRAESYYNLGIALVAQGRVEDAVPHYQRALELKPDYANAHNNLASAFQVIGRLDEAIAHCERAVALNPDHVEAHNNLGSILKDLGRFDDAMKHYARAIAIRPDYAEVHYNRAEIKTFRRGDPDLAALELLARRDDLPATKALHVDFALAKAFEDVGDYAHSFEHLRKGNALKRAQIIYDEAALTELFQDVAAVFDKALLDRFRGAGDPSAVPVFVLGMPRSGSTMIEQMLASHPQIQGGGERTDLETAAAAILNSTGQTVKYPACVATLDDVILKRLGQAYLGRLPRLAGGKLRITDKLPGNFLHIGLIRMILPNARIIHTTRDPMDTCVSCYSKLFSSGIYFSYDLSELGRYYRRYEEMMNHWKTVLPPDDILDVSYEEVVDDLEGQARRLIEYCGLPWDDRCIDFQKNSRPVRTASSVQVRKPLFRKFNSALAPSYEERSLAPAACGS